MYIIIIIIIPYAILVSTTGQLVCSRTVTPPIPYAILVSTAWIIVQELCESRGGRPGLSVLTRLIVFVDVKQY